MRLGRGSLGLCGSGDLLEPSCRIGGSVPSPAAAALAAVLAAALAGADDSVLVLLDEQAATSDAVRSTGTTSSDLRMRSSSRWETLPT